MKEVKINFSEEDVKTIEWVAGNIGTIIELKKATEDTSEDVEEVINSEDEE